MIRRRRVGVLLCLDPRPPRERESRTLAQRNRRHVGVRRARGRPRRRRRTGRRPRRPRRPATARCATSPRACGQNGLPRASVRTASSASARILAAPPRQSCARRRASHESIERAAVGQGALVARRSPQHRPTGPPPRAGPKRWRAVRRARRAPRSARAPRAPPASRASVRRWRHGRSGRRVDRSSTISRAARSTSPAACAYPIAVSGCPFASHQSARASEQTRHEIRLGSLELRAQQLLEEMVVAIPLAGPVERHQEQVGIARAISSIAAEPLSSRTASQSGPDMGSRTAVLVRKRSSSRGRRERSSETQVVGHEPVVATEPGHAVHPGSARLGAERRQVQTRGPALRVLGRARRPRRPPGPGRPRSAAGAPRPRPCSARSARSPATRPRARSAPSGNAG